MCSTDLSWAREARALGGISVAVSITMFAQLAISAVETLIVARLGARALAGVTLALAVYLLLFLFALGIVTAITPIVAGAYGRGDMQELRVSGQQGLWVGLVVSVPTALLLFVCRGIVVRMVGAGAEAESAAAFLAGAAWGLPAWVSYVAVRCLAVATGQARVTTLLMLASVPVHAALTWWLVFGGFGVPACGVAGAGAAYAATAYGALALLAVILCLSPRTAFASVFRYPVVLDPARCAVILRLGLPFACRIVLREGVLPAVAFAVAPFGASAVAAHAVAARIVELTGVFSFGISDAANMRVSYAIGRARPDAATAHGIGRDPALRHGRHRCRRHPDDGASDAAAPHAGQRGCGDHCNGGRAAAHRRRPAISGGGAVGGGRRAQRPARRQGPAVDLGCRCVGGGHSGRIAAGALGEHVGRRHLARPGGRRLLDNRALSRAPATDADAATHVTAGDQCCCGACACAISAGVSWSPAQTV